MDALYLSVPKHSNFAQQVNATVRHKYNTSLKAIPSVFACVRYVHTHAVSKQAD